MGCGLIWIFTPWGSGRNRKLFKAAKHQIYILTAGAVADFWPFCCPQHQNQRCSTGAYWDIVPKVFTGTSASWKCRSGLRWEAGVHHWCLLKHFRPAQNSLLSPCFTAHLQILLREQNRHKGSSGRARDILVKILGVKNSCLRCSCSCCCFKLNYDHNSLSSGFRGAVSFPAQHLPGLGSSRAQSLPLMSDITGRAAEGRMPAQTALNECGTSAFVSAGLTRLPKAPCSRGGGEWGHCCCRKGDRAVQLPTQPLTSEFEQVFVGFVFVLGQSWWLPLQLCLPRFSLFCTSLNLQGKLCPNLIPFLILPLLNQGLDLQTLRCWKPQSFSYFRFFPLHKSAPDSHRGPRVCARSCEGEVVQAEVTWIILLCVLVDPCRRAQIPRAAFGAWGFIFFTN